MTVTPKHLSHQSLHSISLDGVADAPRDGHADPTRGTRVRAATHRDDEVRGVDARSVVLDREELGTPPEPVIARERLAVLGRGRLRYFL